MQQITLPQALIKSIARQARRCLDQLSQYGLDFATDRVIFLNTIELAQILIAYGEYKDTDEIFINRFVPPCTCRPVKFLDYLIGIEDETSCPVHGAGDEVDNGALPI